MTASIRISAAAQRDIEAAKEWYAAQQVPGLDLRFRREVEQVLQRVEDLPLGFPLVHKDVRRANLHRFPYSVFYHQRAGAPFVLAVTHHARHPRVWQRRRR